ncbi:glutaredoxin family protein [Bacillus salipaludis]|uniref:Glutaredoxin family protein n=1 Tax=Bacillus salipaludis TaxID=2547811 RepID=A0A4R5VQN4_9BACI|nr:glutaredoxin family protein [Bacillus salipaludis]MDQ6598702.1 glutaredoxin family protein [Bacillus salipaludis]TDK60754.1 glutaredoxin family protein [Bacillus salipaludis]
MGKELSVVVWAKEGCHYCGEVKQYLQDKGIKYKTIDVTNHDERRDILEIKYGVRHVPVVEVGQNEVYEGVTKVGIEYLEKVLEKVKKRKISV